MKFTAFIAALVLAAAPFVMGAEPKKDPKTKPGPSKEEGASKGEKGMHLPLKGTVLSISPRILTLKGGEGKEPRKFGINKDSVILKGEKPGGHDDVKAGMEVTGSYYREGDKDTLVKLQIKPESKPKSDAKPETKK